MLNFAILPSIYAGFTADTLEVDYVRVYQNETTGFEELSDIEQIFDLKNSPNPAFNYTEISYNLPENMEVSIFVRDIHGRMIEILKNEKQAKGSHKIYWDINYLTPGMYFYTLQTKNNVITKKCLITR